MPAIGENRIFNQLKLMIGEEGEIQLYPNVDEYDIEVELNNKVYQLDVKDFQDPMQLAHKFKEENDISKMMSTHKRKRYLVIPTHRIEIYNKAANKSYIVTIQPSRKEYHKKECSFSEVLLVNVMKIESYFPLKWFQYFR